MPQVPFVQFGSKVSYPCCIITFPSNAVALPNIAAPPPMRNDTPRPCIATIVIPVLDDDKHYWVGDDKVEKLLRHGEGWLAGHPDRQFIADRYLKHRRRLVNAAVERLTDGEGANDADASDALPERADAVADEALPSLHQQRLDAVYAVLKRSDARRVLDLGCGEGRLLKLLLADASFTEIVGVDVASRSLEVAAERLHLDRLPEMQRHRLTLLQGALTYRDRRLAGYDAAALVEVIEHLDPSRLSAFERVLFPQPARRAPPAPRPPL